MENAILKKLLIKSGYTVLLQHAPDDFLATIGDLPADIQFIKNNGPDFEAVITFVATEEALLHNIHLLSPILKPTSLIWVAYPKKSSGIKTELGMMGPWEALKELGFSPCASAAVNETWTAIRLKPSDQIKRSGVGNDSIKNNEYGEFIDVEHKQVTLPSYLKQELQKYPEADQFLDELSWSNRKEYVLWILTAKQESTRSSRIEKMIEMLLQKKKNPTAK